jgi:hypothetical protein
MKLKVLLALDDNHYSDSVLEFAMNELNPERYFLEACFPKKLRTEGQACFKAYYKTGLQELIKGLKKDSPEKKAFEKFAEMSKSRGFEHQIHHTENFSVQNLIRVASYSDLLVCGFETFVIDGSAPDTGNFIREIVKDTRSPVVLVPKHYLKLQNAVLSYDSNSSSLHAIKQFCYTLPDWTDNNPVNVVHIDSEDKPMASCEEKILVEYLKNHCKDVAFHKLSGTPADVLAYALELSPQSILSMGAFSRSMFSMLIRSSVAHELIKGKQAPLFIANL